MFHLTYIFLNMFMKNHQQFSHVPIPIWLENQLRINTLKIPPPLEFQTCNNYSQLGNCSIGCLERSSSPGQVQEC